MEATILYSYVGIKGSWAFTVSCSQISCKHRLNSIRLAAHMHKQLTWKKKKNFKPKTYTYKIAYKNLNSIDRNWRSYSIEAKHYYINYQNITTIDPFWMPACWEITVVLDWCSCSGSDAFEIEFIVQTPSSSWLAPR